MGFARDVVEKAMKDDEFRAQLLTDPRAAIAEAFGVELPENVTIKVHENSPDTFNLVIPGKGAGASRALSTPELEQVAGSMRSRPMVTLPCTNTFC